jgi:hypothetical protein
MRIEIVISFEASRAVHFDGFPFLPSLTSIEDTAGATVY